MGGEDIVHYSSILMRVLWDKSVYFNILRFVGATFCQYVFIFFKKSKSGEEILNFFWYTSQIFFSSVLTYDLRTFLLLPFFSFVYVNFDLHYWNFLLSIIFKTNTLLNRKIAESVEKGEKECWGTCMWSHKKFPSR